MMYSKRFWPSVWIHYRLFLYSRSELIRACKLQGLKMTHGQLNALAKNSHGKLVIVGSKVKCCC